MAGATGETAPLISVALCTYNGERFLREQLDSLLVQDYANLEIVAVDDASRDGTLRILEEYRQRDGRIRIERNATNLGFNENFERALGLCRGDLVAPCDQDDVWEPTKLSRLAAARGDACLVYCDSLLIDERGAPIGARASDKLNMQEGSDPRPFLFYNCISGHAALCTRELVERALPFPREFFHDWWLAMVAAATGRIRYVNECLVRFRQHGASTTNMSGARRKPAARGAGSGSRLVAGRLQRLSRLREMSTASTSRAFFAEAHAAFANWQESYLSPGLARFVERNRGVLFAIPKRPMKNWFMRFFFGLKLRRLFQPRRYALSPP